MGQVVSSTTSHQRDVVHHSPASSATPNAEVHVLPKVMQGLRKHLPELYRQLRVGTSFDPDVVKTILAIVDKACGGLPWPAGLALQAVLFLADNALQAHDNATAGGPLASTIEEVKQKLHRLMGLQVPDEHQDKVKQITVELVAASAVVDDIVNRASARWTCRTCLHAFVCAQCNARKLLNVTAGLEKLLSSIKDIVSDIAIDRIERLCDKPPELPYHLVGMEEQVAKVMEFLGDSGGSTRVVGLHGEGGIGKTTLMKAIEEKLRVESSGTTYKIAIVEVGMQRPPHFLDLQKGMYRQLTASSNLTFSSTAQGRAELKGLFEKFKCEGKKICVFLDNVWECGDLVELLPDRDHLANALPPGSYMLISSRSRDVVAKLANMCFETEHQEREGYLDYKVQILSEEHAEELFIRKASRKGEQPLRRDDPLVQAIVPKCGGLPLALAVYGSYFQNVKMRKPDTWKSVLKKLEHAEDIPSGDDRVFQKLKDSVNFQSKRIQDAFLDAALFFCPQSFYEVKLAMEDDDLDRLMDQSLISESGGWVEVHDLLIVVAKEMAKERNISFVRDGTSEAEIVDIMDHPQVSSIRSFDEQVWCLYAKNTYPSSAQIQDIRYLKLNVTHASDQRREFSLMITKNCDNVQSLELKVEYEEEQCAWIAKLKHLRTLSVKLDSFAGMSKIASELKDFNAHAYLFNDDCRNFPTSLLEASFTTLRRLRITNFAVEMVPDWVSQFNSLTLLQLSQCRSLVHLPEGLGQLGSLTLLHLSGCTSLVHLPEGLGQLGSLTRLFPSLTQLDLSRCTSLVHLPEGLGQLGSLTLLDLSGCTSLVHLPEGLGQLGSLTLLGLHECTSLVHLPEGLGQLGSLTDLLYG